MIEGMGRMMDIHERGPLRTIGLAGDIVSAYVAKNSVPASALPELIGRIHAVLDELVNDTAAYTQTSIEKKATPAQISKSVTTEALFSFIDGRAYKTLKRHLTVHGLDPASYRERYGLPADYPMVASGYAERRSQIAKASRLGQPKTRGDRRGSDTRGRP